MALVFSWDPEKESGNWKKHGVSFKGLAACWLSLTSSVVTISASSTLGSLPVENGLCMKKASKGATSKKAPAVSENDGFLAEYDFSSGVRGKYAERFAAGTNVVVLDPDLAAAFPDSKSVAKALRAYLKSKGRSRSA